MEAETLLLHECLRAGVQGAPEVNQRDLKQMLRRLTSAGLRQYHGEILDGIEIIWPALIEQTDKESA